MRLYKNVDIKDIVKILEEGILPIDVTGNNNWEESRRSNNATNVVYLFKENNIGDSFTTYGLVLLEIEVDAKPNEIDKYDIHKGEYEEYIVSEVPVGAIKAIYIPKIFKNKITKEYNIDLSEYDIKYVDVEFKVYSNEENRYVVADKQVQDIYVKTANISTFDFNYLRGITNNRMLDCEKKWRYKYEME